MVSHEFLQGFLCCALMLVPIWIVLDGIKAIIKHCNNKKEEDDE